MTKTTNGDITRTVTPKTAKRGLLRAMKKNRPIFLWGPPGIGKSDIVAQMGADLNAHVIDVRLALWEPTDIKGIPYFDSNTGTMVWAPPVELPNQEFADQHDQIILFLDEMNSAAPAVQAAAYQLILNRKVGSYELPDNVFIVAAGNREGDRGVTYRMPAPLTNRFVHLEMVHSYDDWFEWAVHNDIHPDVIGFVTFAKESLYQFDPKSSTRAFATPRSWTFVSELLHDGVNAGEEDTTMDLVCGSIGEGLAYKFMAHRRHAADMPNPADILSGKVETLKTKEVSAMYSLTISLCYELKDSQEKDNEDVFTAKFDRFMKFSMENFDTEMVVMGVRVAMTQYDLSVDLDKSKEFDKFHQKYSKFITAAAGGR
jgi:hypothetical protein